MNKTPKAKTYKSSTWLVNGVSVEARNIVNQMAREKGVKLGDIVNDLVSVYKPSNELPERDDTSAILSEIRDLCGLHKAQIEKLQIKINGLEEFLIEINMPRHTRPRSWWKRS